MRRGGWRVGSPSPAATLVRLTAERIDVICPRCQRHATNAPRPTGSRPVGSWPRRLACDACGYAACWPSAESRDAVWGEPVDPFFRIPLWLQAPCRGHLLWALNREHLDLLELAVTAGRRGGWLRPADPTLLASLPDRLTPVRHRHEVLRTIGRLRASLDTASA